jgi:hypothetical protein
MKNRFVISENDRRSILSMYGLLTEEEVVYTFNGTVKDSVGGLAPGCKVFIIDSEEKLVKNESGNVIFTEANQDSEYTITAKLDNTKNYKLRFKYTGESDLVVDINDMSKLIQIIDVGFNEKAKDLKGVTFVQKKPNISGKITDTKGKVLNSVKITWQSELTSGEIKQEENGNYSSDVPLNFTITFEKPYYETFSKQISIDQKNNQKVLNVTLKQKIIIKVIDSKTKQPLGDVDIVEQTKNKKLKTNQNGEITLPDDYDFINLILRKQGYITKTEEFDISKNTDDIVVKLQSRTTENFSIGDEPLDKYKDTMFSIYGRGKTDINNKEAIRLAKVDAINKFIKKHKRVYGTIDIQNLDPDIEYELTYGRPLVKSEKIKEYKYILKFSKKDIKKYLSQFLEKEGIKIDKQPFEFEKMTLSEAIYDGYVGGKELMVVLGISNDDDTIELVNQLKNNGVDKKYLPIFVTVDRRSDDYNRIYELVKPNTYPKIIILKPTSTEKVKVINSDFKINQEEDEKI